MASSALLALALATGPANLATFEATLAQHDSATAALEEWCGARQIAQPPRIRAASLPDGKAKLSGRIRHALATRSDEPVAMRHVKLACGATTLSIATNWYVPARLTPAMREALRTTDIPFGKVVAALKFRREPLATIAGRAAGCPHGTISTHRATLMLPDGRPLAYLIECYTAANLAAR